jgi:archaellum biogenesis ATPase FlaH
MRHELVEQQDVNQLAASWRAPDDAEDGGPIPTPQIRSIAEIAPVCTYASRGIEFVVEGLIAAGTVTMISGESGAGKTTIVTSMCGAVESGTAFAGLQTQRRPVLMLDNENPVPVVNERLERLGIQDGENFKIWGGWVEEPPAPFSPLVLEWVAGCTPKPLIVVDSLVSFHPGSENDATETRTYMQQFRRLADAGATVILLHHSGKADSAKDYRGSSDIKASIDVGYHLANLGDPSRLELLRLRAFKSRFRVQTEILFRYTDGQFRMNEVAKSRSIPELLRELLEGRPGIKGTKFESLAAEKGLGRDRARLFLQHGVEAGTIRLEQGDHNSKYYTLAGEESVADLY